MNKLWRGYRDASPPCLALAGRRRVGLLARMARRRLRRPDGSRSAGASPAREHVYDMTEDRRFQPDPPVDPDVEHEEDLDQAQVAEDVEKDPDAQENREAAGQFQEPQSDSPDDEYPHGEKFED